MTDTARQDDSEASAEQLAHERRDERRHVRMQLPFRVAFEQAATVPGHDISLGGFSFYLDEPIESGALRKGTLLLAAGSAELSIPIEASCLRCHFDDDEGRYLVAFAITRLDPSQRELLRRVIRAYLAGRHASVDELIGGEDPQTPRKASVKSEAVASSGARSTWRYGLLALAVLGLMLVGALTLYRNVLLIEPDFAAVTAPRVDIVSPGNGVLDNHGLVAGDRVTRDEPLVRIDNHDLEAELALARAGTRFNRRLVDNLQSRLADTDSEQVSLFNAIRPDNYRTSAFETVPPEVAQGRLEQLEASVDFEQARVNALETRMVGHRVFSPCDCRVAWAINGAGDVYVQEGDTLMTLIRTAPDEIMVETLVHMSDISRIEPGQLAFVRLPGVERSVPARVRSVALDIEQQPRAGFPHWVRQQQNVASVLLVPEQPLPAAMVGHPVEVRFSDAPILSTTADWLWDRLVGWAGRLKELVSGPSVQTTGQDGEVKAS